jgi:hypothetical protein
MTSEDGGCYDFQNVEKPVKQKVPSPKKENNFFFYNLKMVVFWVVATCNLVEVFSRFRSACSSTSTSEMSVFFYQTTRRDNPEDSHLHARRCENLISHYFITLRTSYLTIL